MASPIGSANHRSRNGLGVLLILGAMSIVPLIDVTAKALSQHGMPVLQITLLRMIGGAMIIAPVLIRYHGARALLPRNVPRALKLGAYILGAAACFFAALQYLPIAETLAISFVQPLVVTLLSRLVLKERVDRARWGALFAGFAATIVIIRPGSEAFNPASLLALASGVMLAFYVITVRASASVVPALVTTFHTHIVSALLAAPFILLWWVPPNETHWQLCAALALVGVIGQFLIVKAYEYGEASLLAPLAYTEIVTSTLAGWWFFDEMPDSVTFLGVAALIGCAIFISRSHAGPKEANRS
ncbi:DMT family transporter [Microvirga sp. M2]|uniref:DMT family transporter n=1 Tax=Microvirga sp. M2 TaxID=3073270 RepID=UPI0039C02E10